MKLTRKEPEHTATLQEVIDLGAIVVAGEFEGRILDYETTMDMPEDIYAEHYGSLIHSPERDERGASTRLDVLWGSEPRA